MRNDIIKIFLTIILTFVSTLSIQYFQNRTRVLEYKVTKQTNIINKPHQLDDKIKIFIDSSKIDNLSILRLEIYNTSGRTQSNLDLFFELEPTSSNKVVILSENYYGQDNSDEFVTPIKKEQSKGNVNGLKLGYKIKVANNNNELEPVFVVEYYFRNGDIPNITKPTFVNAGINSQEFNLEKYIRNRDLRNTCISIPIALSIVFLFLNIVGRLSNRNQEKRKLTLLRLLVERLKYSQEEEFQKLINPARTIALLEFTKEEYFYNKSPKWVNWIIGLKKPFPLKEREVDKVFNEFKK